MINILSEFYKIKTSFRFVKIHLIKNNISHNTTYFVFELACFLGVKTGQKHIPNSSISDRCTLVLIETASKKL